MMRQLSTHNRLKSAVEKKRHSYVDKTQRCNREYRKGKKETAYRHRLSNNYLLSVGQKEGPYLILKESKSTLNIIFEHSQELPC